MSQPPFVPDDFTVPTGLTADGFRLEPLGPQHNESDHDAWTSSIDHIRAIPGFRDRGWPPPSGMSPAGNLRDLERHADDFAQRTGFTYTVLERTVLESTALESTGAVIGCVYIYPSRSDAAAYVRSWVRADRAELDGPLYEAVSAWLAEHWPFPTVRYR